MTRPKFEPLDTVRIRLTGDIRTVVGFRASESGDYYWLEGSDSEPYMGYALEIVTRHPRNERTDPNESD